MSGVEGAPESFESAVSTIETGQQILDGQAAAGVERAKNDVLNQASPLGQGATDQGPR